MPIYLDIDRLEQVVMIVAHGAISDDDIRRTAEQVIAADVVAFAKIIDNTAAVINESHDQVAAIVRMLRAGPDSAARGPVACVVDAHRPGFAKAFAEQSAGDRPIKLFTSLRAARQWASEMRLARS